MLRFLTAGESHGRGLVAIVEGLPAGLPITVDEIAQPLTELPDKPNEALLNSVGNWL